MSEYEMEMEGVGDVDWKTAPLNELARLVVEDGKIDAEEVRMIEERISEDGMIDQEEAEFLFTINDIVSGNDNTPEFQEFFVEAITAFVLADEMSPGVLDEYEWDWLKAMMGEDGQIDETEAKLMVNIAEQSVSVPEDFDTFAKQFEEFEYEDFSGSSFLYARIARALGDKVRAAGEEG